MHVLVTGSRGFVGRRLVRRLDANGSRVSAADRELDVTDQDRVAAWLRDTRPDAVVHLAAQSSVVDAARDPRDTFRVNYLGAASLLRAVSKQAPEARVLLVGSGEEYGPGRPGDRPTAETDPLRPASAYARTKAAVDLLGAVWGERGLDVVRVRAFNHTGPGQSDRFVSGSFACQLAAMEAGLRAPVLRVGNLDALRDFLHVDDVVEAYLALLEPSVPAGVYNVASGRPRRIREVLDLLIAHAHVHPSIQVDPERVRPGDQLLGDASRLQKATGWSPARSLESALLGLLESWRERIRV